MQPFFFCLYTSDAQAAPYASSGGKRDTGSGNGADSQSDSYSEYLAAMEAERLDRQLAAEAEEREAKLDAEALLLPPPPREGGGGGGGGDDDDGGIGEAAVAPADWRGRRGDGRRPAGRHYFSPGGVEADTGAEATKGRGGGEKRAAWRRRRAEVGGVEPGYVDAHLTQEDRERQQQQQPRIIFKEQWREKEARVWQERGAAGGHGGFHGGFRARSSRDGGDGSAEEAGCGAVPSKGWKLLPIIVKVCAFVFFWGGACAWSGVGHRPRGVRTRLHYAGLDACSRAFACQRDLPPRQTTPDGSSVRMQPVAAGIETFILLCFLSSKALPETSWLT